MVNLAKPQSASAAEGMHAPPRHPAYRLGQSWVVVDGASRQLLVLNDSAYRIWHAWQDGLDAEAIAQRLGEHFDLDPQQLLPDVVRTLEPWQSAQREPAPAEVTDWRQPTLLTLPAEPPSAPARAQDSCRVLDVNLRFHYDNEQLRRLVQPLFAHHPPADGPCLDYHLESVGDDYRLRQGRRVIFQGATLDWLAVALLNETSLAAYRHRDPLCVLHAAGLGRDGRCIALPGVAGAGKSTLSAALLHSGLEYLSDDTLPIDGTDGAALALRPPLCIKTGSLPVLAERYPELAGARLYERADQPVRYLCPQSPATTDSYQVAALVFPSYQPGSAASLEPLAPEAALTQLLAAGLFALRPDEPQRIGALLEWIGQRPAYHLAYSDLDEACRLVRPLLEGKDARATSTIPESQYEETAS